MVVETVEDEDLQEVYEKIERVWQLSAASRAVSAATEVQGGAVIFQTDSLYLLAKNGSTMKIVCSFDNHGSENFLSGDLPDEFDYNNGEKTSNYRVETVHGSQSNSHSLCTIRLLTLKGVLTVKTVSAKWVSVEDEPQVDKELATKYKISVPRQVESNLRLILGAAELVHHPRPHYTPPKLREAQPGLLLFKSQLSGLLLARGLYN